MKPSELIKYTMLFAVAFSSSCNQRESKHTFGPMQLSLPANCEVQAIKDQKTEKQWVIRLNGDSILVQHYSEMADGLSDSSSYGHGTSNSSSLYDTYLSMSPVEKSKYNISYIKVEQNPARVVKRKYEAGRNFLEVSLKHICSKPSILQITGDRLQEESTAAILNALSKAELNCK